MGTRPHNTRDASCGSAMDASVSFRQKGLERTRSTECFKKGDPPSAQCWHGARRVSL